MNSTPPVLHANFWEDVRVSLLNALTSEGVRLAPGDQDDVKKVCMAFFTLTLRTVAPWPRATHRSLELNVRFPDLSDEVQAGVRLIEARSLAGEDLGPHLSHKARRPYALPDWLLNDWGIHHLHVRHGQGDELLFACIEDDTIYLIDVLDHGSMAELDLLESILYNWPSLLREVPGIRGPAPGGPYTTAQEIDEARRAGVQPLVTLSNGKVYGPRGGGLTTAGGSSGRAVMQMHRVLKRARALQQLCQERAEIIARALKRREFTLRYDAVSDQVIEEITGEPLIFEQ